MFLCLKCTAATVTFNMTNSVGVPDTNSIKITPIAAYINANGSVQTIGLPFRVNPNTNGFASTNLSKGFYLATNQFLVSNFNVPGSFGTSQGIIFAVPDSAGTYAFGTLAQNGYNVFNMNPLLGLYTNVISVLGFTPLTPQQTTNLFSLSNTNQYAPGTNISFATNSGTITISSIVPSSGNATNVFLIAGTNVSIATNASATWTINVPTQSFLTNGLITPAVTNGLATTGYVAQAVSTYTPTNWFIPATNNLATNSAAQLSSTSNSISLANIATSNSLATSIATSSNLFQFSKQPASATLTNLALTGALTNQLVFGTNITSVTQNFGATIVIQVPSQTFLTNGLVTTNGLTAAIIAIGAITNNGKFSTLTGGSLLLTNYSDGSGSTMSNGALNTISVSTLSLTITNRAFNGTNNNNGGVSSGFNSNGVLVAFNGGGLYGNFLRADDGTTVVISITNQPHFYGVADSTLFSTNANNAAFSSLASEAYNWINPSVLHSATGFNFFLTNNYYTNTSLQFSINPLSTNWVENFGVTFATNFNGIPFGNYFLSNGNMLDVTTPILFYSQTNFALASVTNNLATTNYANGVTNGFTSIITSNPAAYYSSSNPSNYPSVMTTNGRASLVYSGLNTNVVGITGAGSAYANGIYLGFNSTTWTNPFISGVIINLTGSTYFLQSNSVSLYESPDAVNWTAISGTSPAPYGAFGTIWNMNVSDLFGEVHSVSLMRQMTNTVNAVSPGIAQNTSVGGVVSGVVTNENFSAAGSNYIYSVATNVAPTGGGTGIATLNGFGTNTSFFQQVGGGGSVWPVSLIAFNGLGFLTNTLFSSSASYGSGGAPNQGIGGWNYLGGGNGNLGVAYPFQLIYSNAPFGDEVDLGVNKIWTKLLILNGTSITTTISNTTWGVFGNAITNGKLGTLTLQPLILIANSNTVAMLESPFSGNTRITFGYSNLIAADSMTVSNRNSAILSGQYNYIQGGANDDSYDGRGHVIVGGDSNTNKSTGFGFIGTGMYNLLSSTPFEFIGDGASNHVDSTSFGTILNGGNNYVGTNYGPYGVNPGASTILNGYFNSTFTWLSLIGGGYGNTIGLLTPLGDTSQASFIGTGLSNSVNKASYSFIATGNHNSIVGAFGTLDQYNSILNGASNTINISAHDGAFNIVADGYGNSIIAPAFASPTANFNTIGNGFSNVISGTSFSTTGNGVSNSIYSDYSTIENGSNNFIGGNSRFSFIASGVSNQVMTNSPGGVAIGHRLTVGQTNATAMGVSAIATNNLSFVWSDGLAFNSITNSQFLIHATNGVGINTNITGTNALEVLGNIDSTVGYTVNGISLTNGLATTNFVNSSTAGIITNTPTPSGTNDSAMLQFLLSKTNVIYGGGQTYISLTNLYVTNSVTIKDIIIVFSNVIGTCFDGGLSTNISCYNVKLNGSVSSNYPASAVIPIPIFAPAIFPAQGGNSAGSSTGFRFNCSGGGVVDGCTAQNFNDVGFFLFDYNGTQAYTLGQRMRFVNNSSYDDFVGLHANGNDYTGYPSITNVNSSSFSGSAAEYMTIANYNAENCGVGLYSGAGNFNVNGATLTGCLFGMGGVGLNNPLKGQWNNITCNHDTYAGYIRAGVLQINNLICLANTGPLYVGGGCEMNIANARFDANSYPNVPIVVTNDFNPPAGHYTALKLVNSFNYLAGITNMVKIPSTNAVCYFWGNFDDQGNTDGTLAMGLGMMTNSTGAGNGTISFAGFSGNGGGLTNLSATAIVGTVTATNLISGGFYTNSTGAKYTVFADEVLTAAASVGATGFQILYDPAGGHNWQTNCDGTISTVALSIAGMVTRDRLVSPIANGGVWCLTNVTTVGSASSANTYISQP